MGKLFPKMPKEAINKIKRQSVKSIIASILQMQGVLPLSRELRTF
jgi:hypothetical protein